jgi:hypothetical protein
MIWVKMGFFGDSTTAFPSPWPDPVVRSFAILTTLLLISLSVEAANSDRSLRGPDVTIIEGEKRTIYEFRQAGQLRMIKIVPSFGKPYYLVPADETRGFGDLERADMLIPRWTIIEF